MRGRCGDIAFDAQVAFVADGRYGLSVIDISEPDSPRLLATKPVPDFAHGVAAAKGILYAAEGIAGIGVYRFEPPASLELVHRVETPGGYANKVTINADRLLVANDVKGVVVFELTDPSRPSSER